MDLIGLIPGGLPALLGGLIVFVVGIAWKAFTFGKQLERNRREEAELRAIREKQEVDDEIDQLGSADIDQRFERYRR